MYYNNNIHSKNISSSSTLWIRFSTLPLGDTLSTGTITKQIILRYPNDFSVTISVN